MVSGQIAWKHELDTGNLVIVPHLTAIERKSKSGYFFQRQAPRIGIDFVTGEAKVFFPNLEPGDVLHLMEVLAKIENDTTYRRLRSEEIRPFTISLTFKRRIVIQAGSKHGSVLVKYYVGSSARPLFSREFPRRFLGKFRSILDTLLGLYMVVIKMRKNGRRIPKEFVETERYEF